MWLAVMQHCCSRNLTDTTDLLFFYFFGALYLTIYPVILKFLQGYWAALEASKHFKLTLEMFSSLRLPERLLSMLKTLNNFKLAYWNFCMKNFVLLACIEKWLLWNCAALAIRMVIIITYSIIFVTTFWRNVSLVSVTGEIVFILSNWFV